MVIESEWLLIYDNAVDPDLLLEYWPVANHGKALVTTRNHSIAFAPADVGIEVLPFDPEAGSKFLLSLLSLDIAADISSGETESAYTLAEKLSGHALAISQMAAFIHRRSWTIEEFLAVYEKNTQKMHGLRGYTSLDAVWQISFESLNPTSSAFLGVLSYMMPDSIPQALFETHDPACLPDTLSFCNDALRYEEILVDMCHAYRKA